MADGINVANAYVQIMPSMQGAESSIQDALAPAMEQAGEASGSLLGGGIMGKLQSMGPMFAKVGGMIVGALGAAKIGDTLLGIGGEFDAMSDAIAIATGASGNELAELGSAAREVATTIPVSFEEAGQMIGDISTRMGLAGQDLEDVASRAAALGSMMDGAINLDALTGSLNAFGVAGDEAAGKMDYLFGVSQNTGIGFDQLTGILETNAPSLQSLGFSFEEAANMAGLLDRAGMDASGTMAKMSKALVTLAEPGEDAADAYQRVVGEIGAFIEAGDTASAIDLASQVFGTRGAAQFVGAIESGALAMDQLTDASLGAGEGIIGTFEATADWPERWELIKNKAAEALEPLGGALMDGVTRAFESISSAMDEIDPAIFETIGAALGELVEGGVDVLGGAIEGIMAHKDEIAAFFTDFGLAASKVWAVLQPFATFLGNVFVGVVLPAVSAAFKAISGDFRGAGDVIKGVVSRISSALGFDGVVAKVTGIFNSVKSAISNPVESARETIRGIVDRIKGIFSGLKLSLPHFSLPHFKVNGGKAPWGIAGKGTPPSFSVDWYAKGGIVDGAQLIGAGEKGPELIWPSYEPYLSKYADAVAGSIGKTGGDVYNITLAYDAGADANIMARDLMREVKRIQLTRG